LKQERQKLLDMAPRKPKKPSAKPTTTTSTRTLRPRTRPAATKLLSGGNPQIPKGYGDAPVQAYVAAMPDWRRGVGRRIDELITAAIPDVRKAVKWNSPFYGVDPTDKSWFLSFHTFAKYVKVTFMRGTSLDPVPPGKSKWPGVRYLDIREDGFDEEQFTDWVKQASRLPGEPM
jgi:hypothetical protein